MRYATITTGSKIATVNMGGGGEKSSLGSLLTLRPKKKCFENSKKQSSGHNCLSAEMASDGVGPFQKSSQLNLYLFLQDTDVSDTRFVKIWNLKLPMKVKNFVWLVLRRRILTTDSLQKRDWNGTGFCIFCLGTLETVDHLFVGCNTSSSLLRCQLLNKAGVRAGAAVD